jgi:hypothetical protein
MLRVFCNLTISDSVFRGNSFSYFLGTSAGWSVRVTFLRCVFDGDVVNAANSVKWDVFSRMTSLTGCITRTALPTRTASVRPTPEIVSGSACANGRKSLSMSTLVRDCAFTECIATDGGAIHLGNEAADLWIVGCHFTKCRSADGGAVSALCQIFSVATSEAIQCNGWSRGAFLFATATQIDIRESVSESSITPQGILYLRANADSAIESWNASANTATLAGSAMQLWGGADFALRFAVVVGNAQANCLAFADIHGLDVFCFSIVNNSCVSTTDYVGLITAAAAVTMTNCIFRANRFDFFIGRPSHGNVTFTKCAFDFDMRWAPVAGSVAWVTTACVREPGQTSFSDCRTRTPTPTQTVGPGPARSKGLPITTIIASCIGAVVVIVAGAIFCAFSRARPTLQPTPTPLLPGLDLNDLETADLFNAYRARSFRKQPNGSSFCLS